jgi:ABC-2 type transport system permease protein
MLNEFGKTFMFAKRDFSIFTTYKLALSMQFLTIIINLFYFVAFGSMFNSNPQGISQYGGDFISYILIGSIGWGFLWNIMSATATSLRQEMMMGTLESILLTPTKLYTIVVGYSIFGCLFSFISITILSLSGYAFFGISAFANATPFTIFIFFISAIMMMGFGMIFSGLTIWQKDIGSTTPVFQNIAMFFCGVYFPISVLPTTLQPISKYVPFYYSIEGLRKSLIPSTSQEELLYYILILTISTLVITAIGFYTMHKGLLKAKKDGTLAFY